MRAKVSSTWVLVTNVFVSEQGLDGDGHRFHMHGGPDKAVCVYAIEIIEALQKEGTTKARRTIGCHPGASAGGLHLKAEGGSLICIF